MTDQAEEGRIAISDAVKRFDRDRYWSALYAPEPVRTHLLTLAAFNIELSRIPEQVSEPMFGEVRLQWWRDALEKSGEHERTGHPVADAIIKTRIGYGLPEHLLYDMIDARVFDLGRDPMPDIPALRVYLTRTAGAVFRLGCVIAGERSEAAEAASNHAAMAYGLTGLMRALPYHAARGLLYLPAAHFAAHNVETADILAGEAKPQLFKALSALRAAAKRYLEAFREAAAALSPSTAPVFLPLALVEPYLDKMARQDFEPLRCVAELNPAYRYWRLARAYSRGRI